ncbi:TPA: hypothetical protein ACVO0U_003060 [Vibrio alginolyticus]
MNLEVLQYLVDDAPHYLEENAQARNLDVGASIGIARRLLGNDGDITELSPAQLYHYDNVIKPLIENVSCDGVLGEMEDDDGNWFSTCNGDGSIDDESLLMSYQEEDFKCQICRFDAERMAAE